MLYIIIFQSYMLIHKESWKRTYIHTPNYRQCETKMHRSHVQLSLPPSSPYQFVLPVCAYGLASLRKRAPPKFALESSEDHPEIVQNMKKWLEFEPTHNHKIR